MNRSLRAAAASAAFMGILAAPLLAGAAPSNGPAVYTLPTRYFGDRSAGEYDGVLRLVVNNDGIVQGTYRNADAGGFKTVTGAVEANGHIWLDIGGVRALHLYGTFRDGKLIATAQTPGPEIFTLESTNVTANG